MRTNILIKTIFSYCMLWAAYQNAFAALSNIVCPTADEIKQYRFEIGFPYGFDAKLNLPKYMVAASPNGDIINKKIGSESNWDLFMYPLHAGQSTNLQDVTLNVLNNLVPVSSTPFEFNMIEDDLEIKFCAYTHPGDTSISALAYFNSSSFDDDDDDEYDDMYAADKYVKNSPKKTKQSLKNRHTHLLERMAKIFRMTNA